MKKSGIVLFLILVVALGLRARFADRSLWEDEAFSLCMASGHSIETAPVTPSDYRDPPAAVAASSYLRYSRPEGGIGASLSAVARSDTSPPLYYVVLRLWYSVFGVSVAAGRWLSLGFNLLTVLAIYRLGSLLGPRVGLFAALLMAVTPLQVGPPGEIRMYGLLLFVALASMLCTVRICRGDARRSVWVWWVLANIAGLYTHYIFVPLFVAAQILLLAAVRRGTAIRLRPWLLSAGACIALFLPWLPSVRTQFWGERLTAGWLDASHSLGTLLIICFNGIGGLLTGGWYRWPEAVLAALVYLAALVLAYRAGERNTLLFLVVYFLLPLGYIVGIDLVRSTEQVAMLRYLILAAPAMLLAAAYVGGRMPRRVGYACVLLLAAVLAVRSYRIMEGVEENWFPFQQAAAHLVDTSGGEDLLLVRSIPSGVVALCHYLDGSMLVGSLTTMMDLEETERRLQTLLRDHRGDSIRLVVASTGWSDSFDQATADLRSGLQARFGPAVETSFGSYDEAVRIYRFATPPGK